MKFVVIFHFEIQLAEKVRQHMKDKQRPIVEQSENEDDCVQKMEKEIDDFVDSVVKQDEGWTEVPRELIDELIEEFKKEHDPIYRNAFVISVSDLVVLIF